MSRVITLPDPDPATVKIHLDKNPAGEHVVHICHGDDIVTVPVLMLPDVTQDAIASLRSGLLNAGAVVSAFTARGYYAP